MAEEVKAEVVDEEGKKVVYLPVCRRVAGEVVCEEKGLKVVYAGESEGKRVLEEVEIKYPRAGEAEEETIVVTAKYKKGVIGPLEVSRRVESE